MLRIEVEGQNVDLSPDMSINLSFKSPVFDDDNASRAHSLPHRLPMSPAMMNRLENMNRLDSAADLETLEEKIYIGGQLLAKGKFVIEKASQYIDGHFTNEAKSYSADLDGVKLHDLIGNIEIEQPIVGKCELKVEPPYYNRSYYLYINEIIVTFNATANDTLNGVASKIATEITNRTGLRASANPSYRPNVIVIESIEHSIRLRPWSSYMQSVSIMSYKSLGTARSENFVNFIRNSVSTPRGDISFARMQNFKFYEDNYLYNFVINPCDKSNGIWSIKQNLFQDVAALKADKIWNYNYVPFVRVKFLLGKIGEKMGVSVVTGNFPKWTELFNNLIIYNNYALDATVTEWQFNTANATETEKIGNVGATNIDLKNHCPDMTGREFLRIFCESFCLSWSVVDGQLLFLQKEALLKKVSNLILHKVVPDSIERGFKRREGFTFRYADSKTDTAAQPATSYIQGDGKTIIQLPTVGMTDVIGYGKRYCCVEEVGSSSLKKNNDSLEVRWMMDRGEQIDSAGDSYIQSTIFLGDTPLHPSKLIQWTWMYMAHLKANGFPISLRVNADIGVLKKIIDWEAGVYRISTPYGAISIAIEQIDITASLHALHEFKLTGYAQQTYNDPLREQIQEEVIFKKIVVPKTPTETGPEYMEELIQLRAANATLSAERNAADASNSALRVQNSNLQAQLAVLQSDTDCEAQKTVLRTQLAAAENTTETVRTQLRTAQTTCTQEQTVLRTQLATAQNTTETVRTQLATAQNTTETVRTQLAAAQTTCTQQQTVLRTQLATAETQRDAAQNEAALMSKDYSNALDRVVILEAQVRTLILERDSLRTQLAAFSTSSSSEPNWKLDYLNLLEQHKALIIENEALTARINELEKK
jgi:hypothetical protein